jgi:hypothetical protein
MFWWEIGRLGGRFTAKLFFYGWKTKKRQNGRDFWREIAETWREIGLDGGRSPANWREVVTLIQTAAAGHLRFKVSSKSLNWLQELRCCCSPGFWWTVTHLNWWVTFYSPSSPASPFIVAHREGGASQHVITCINSVTSAPSPRVCKLGRELPGVLPPYSAPEEKKISQKLGIRLIADYRCEDRKKVGEFQGNIGAIQ